jgi:Mrp family chromosome partitioning ATPase
MEKLQAALARAREKRDNEGRPLRSKEGTVVRPRRAAAQEAAIAERWDQLQSFQPSAKRMHNSRVFAGEATIEAQHFDILRTKLLLEMRRNDWVRIAVTSATVGCGKTTIACNLISGLGRQPEIRGMLFDLDFRRPAVAKFFGATPSASLEDVFGGKAEFADQAMRFHPNTAISMTTRAVHDPAQVILRSQTGDVLDEIQADYRPDLMLFDMPPVLVSDETRGFLKQVDAVLIVAGAETSTISQIDEVEREVAQYSNIAGVVLNKCRFMEEGYGYSY